MGIKSRTRCHGGKLDISSAGMERRCAGLSVVAAGDSLVKTEEWLLLYVKYRDFQNIYKKKITTLINLDNLLKLILILTETILITKDAEFKNDNQLSEKIRQLFDMLIHMQSLNISIRAELIAKLFSISPERIMNQITNGAEVIALYDRRKVNQDRRKLHTYLANDRRIGMANRLKSTKNRMAEIRSR